MNLHHYGVTVMAVGGMIRPDLMYSDPDALGGGCSRRGSGSRCGGSSGLLGGGGSGLCRRGGCSCGRNGFISVDNGHGSVGFTYTIVSVLNLIPIRYTFLHYKIVKGISVVIMIGEIRPFISPTTCLG